MKNELKICKGTSLLGMELFDSLTKSELATICYYLAQRIESGNERDLIKSEHSVLVENGILKKKK